MKNRIKTYKRLIIWVTISFIAILVFLTIDAINETNNWSWFKVDFDERDHIIAAYGALIGGILAFLSILFVIYQILEQRQQLLEEKRAKIISEINEKKDLLKLLSSFLGTIVKVIKDQGDNLKKFYEKELEYPTLSNQAYFLVNQNFNRIIEMDYAMIYKAFRHFFHEDENWEKTFINFYKSIDFYLQMTPHILENYRSQTKEKVKLKYEIQEKIQSFLQRLHQFRNAYIQNIPPPFNIRSFKWFLVIDDFWFQYSQYVAYIENSVNKAKIDSDLSDLKNTYFEPLFDSMHKLKKSHYPVEFGEDELLDTLGEIIIKIKQLEVFAINYANDVKKSTDSYYSADCDHLTKLGDLKDAIDNKLND